MPVSLLKLCPAADALAPDPELLGRFVSARDEAAFAELVRRHGPIVHRVCRRLAPAHADDAFQAVFLVLACRAGRVRTPGAVGSWLVGVAGRVARQMQLTDARRAHHERQVARTERTPTAPDAGELAAVLDDELARLPDALRAPVMLCLIGGRTHAQAAAALGGSVRTLRRRLERAKTLLRTRLGCRGVVPAVAAALVAGVGQPAAAIPPALAGRTVSVVFQFLNGDAPQTAAVAAAKGVMGGMVKLKVSALTATAAAVLVCLGVAWVRDRATAAPPGPARASGPVDQPLAGSPAVPAAEPERIPPLDVTRAEVKTANFIVHAPTPMMIRVIAAEAEHHRRALALKLLGQELPPWEKPCVIRFVPAPKVSGGATVFTFGTDKGAPVMATAETEVRGDFLSVLASTLPHEVTHTVLASYFGKPIPRWADEGIAALAESEDEHASHDARVRDLLNAGRGIRLRVLFRMTEYPRDMIVLYAQGYSVARFLAGTSGPGVAALKGLPHVGRLFRNPGADGHRRLVAFVQLGMDGNTAESWDKAAKSVYGFDSVNALEEAWLEWLAKPESAPARKAAEAPVTNTRDGSIPPLELPAAPPRTAPNQGAGGKP